MWRIKWVAASPLTHSLHSTPGIMNVAHYPLAPAPRTAPSLTRASAVLYVLHLPDSTLRCFVRTMGELLALALVPRVVCLLQPHAGNWLHTHTLARKEAGFTCFGPSG